MNDREDNGDVASGASAEPDASHVGSEALRGAVGGATDALDERPIGDPGVRRLSPPLPDDAPAVLRLLRTVRRLVEGLYIHDGLSAGPAMAFHFFLSLLPLLVVVGWVLGHVARARGVEALLAPIFETAPSAVTQIGKRELERLAATDLSAAPLAVVGFLWLASSGIHGMMDAFERALSVPIRRPYWKKRLYSLAFVFAGLTATAFIAFASVGLESIAQVATQATSPSGSPPPASATVATGPASASAVPVPSLAAPQPIAEAPSAPSSEAPAPSVEAGSPSIDGGAVAEAEAIARPVVMRVRAKFDRALAVACFLVLSVSGVAAFYRIAVESPKSVTRRVWPGAMLAIALWLLISWGFGVYVASLGQYTLYYGSLAAVAVLLVWFWLTSLALLVGAELNAQLEGHRH